jgi:hypothetical protein
MPTLFLFLVGTEYLNVLCRDCQTGEYGINSVCKECPRESYSNRTGATECLKCLDSEYSISGRECRAKPDCSAEDYTFTLGVLCVISVLESGYV